MFRSNLHLPSKVLIREQLTTDSGFFLKQDPGRFDAGFFSMTAAEAAGTDPQQRMCMELAYEALENGSGNPIAHYLSSLTNWLQQRELP